MTLNPDERLRVLFLPRWYPNRYDPMPGLFVQQQAEVLAGLCEVAVLYIHPDASAINTYELDMAEESGVHAIRVYVKTPAVNLRIIRNIIQLFRTIKAYRMGFRVLRKYHPHLIHVHVLTRQGVAALARKWQSGVPYIITEHWSRYLPENKSYRGLIRRWMTRVIVMNSSGIIAVSATLKNAMIGCGLNHRYFKVIPNLVDTDHFVIKKRTARPGMKRILHISCFDDRSKNISGFLRTVRTLSMVRNDFECLLIGDGPDLPSLKEYAGALGLPGERVKFTGLLTGNDLADTINSGDFLVLSSNYETFGTVIIECLACGVPVVATRTGIAPEVIHEKNGRLVAPGNDEELGKSILEMLDLSGKFDREEIRQEVINRFGRQNVGQEMYQTYLQCLKK